MLVFAAVEVEGEAVTADKARVLANSTRDIAICVPRIKREEFVNFKGENIYPKIGGEIVYERDEWT